tara:strand:+ start:277 stop:579 length:303 start_codon:yes stop_codon:yes gene_type:complete
MDFTQKVYQKTKQIPKGKISTYKDLAHSLNSKAYRAVGNALNKNPHKEVPCHRIIKSNGEIGGFAKGTKEKIEILKKEGIEIKNNKINLKKYLHNFQKHI